MRLIWIKRLAIVALLFYAAHEVSHFCIRETDGFTIAKIRPSHAFHPEWEVGGGSLPSDILKQPFYYLDSGGQCFAFLSADGQYVLKFFKNHFRSVFPLSAKKQAKREKKLLRDFTSYTIAFQELREECGLLYLHINPTEHLQKRVSIVDKLGIQHELSLDQHAFILQKRADLVYPYFERLIQRGEKEEARAAISALVALIADRCQKGIFDEDARIHRNFGFIDKQAILIDVGRLRKDATRMQREVYTQDVRIITKRWRAWLLQQDPSLSAFLDQEIERYAQKAT